LDYLNRQFDLGQVSGDDLLWCIVALRDFATRAQVERAIVLARLDADGSSDLRASVLEAQNHLEGRFQAARVRDEVRILRYGWATRKLAPRVDGSGPLAGLLEAIQAARRTIGAKQPSDLPGSGLRLIMEWPDAPGERPADAPDGWTNNRLVDARRAELAAMEIYGRRAGTVEDVAIGQLSGGDRWRAFDLLVDGRQIDIKNVRLHRDGVYFAETRIGPFKNYRGRAVVIGGMATYFGREDCLWLGEVSAAMLNELAANYDRGRLEVGLARQSDGPDRAPPWLFAYPRQVYQARDSVLRAVAESGSDTDKLMAEARRAQLNPVPLGLLLRHHDMYTRASSEAGVPPNMADSVWRNFEPRTGHHLTLPEVCLLLLHDFLDALERSAREYTPRYYSALLFLTRARRPLGVLDPLKTVSAWIDVLDSLWQESRTDPALRNIRQFRLQGHGLLQGREGHGTPWKTLVAYCSRCAKAPIVAGLAPRCPCGGLLCPFHNRLGEVCGACRASCSERSRQH